ncbi:MAG: type II secretion system F family protein [Candidatus Thermoplasmatota archaeon]|nr:type II secretion system F family protein [Candidatus Thermoplasmatota archaeon]
MAKKSKLKISEKHVKFIISGSSISSAIVLIILAILKYQNRIEFGSMLEFIIPAILLIAGPYPFYLHIKRKRIDKIEDRLSDFLRDLAESGRFGMTLADSIRKASRGDYGKLTPEIKKMAAHIDWGVPAEEALELFAKRVNTPLVNRAMAIVMKASRAGGDISDVLGVAAANIKDIQLLQQERKVEMGSYVAVIYTAFFVFLAVVIILNAVFLPAMAQHSVTAGAEGAVVAKPELDLEELKMIYLGGAITQGIGDGILIGIIDTGRVASGLRHSFIMVLLGFIVMRMFVLV